jgi:hypothetical protein
VWQWNAAIEHAFTEADTASITYAGSRGRGLLRREVAGLSSSLSAQADVTNRGQADYHSLQLQWRRRLARGVQANAAYAWSHSIDNASSDALLHWIAGATVASNDRGSSDFDVRHSLNIALRFDSPTGGMWSRRWLRSWSLDLMARARTGFPLDVAYSESSMGVSFANAFRPDWTGAPIWIADTNAPAGRVLNGAAFTRRAGFEQGNLGRNAITGFGMGQLDAALSRDFALAWGKLNLRAEAFNITNHANFADPVRYLASQRFGQSAAMLNLGLGNGTPASGLSPMLQIGGPRSAQVSLRWTF